MSATKESLTPPQMTDDELVQLLFGEGRDPETVRDDELEERLT